MAYSSGLIINPDTSNGLTGWTASNVTIEDAYFVLATPVAILAQSRSFESLDFTPSSFKVTLQILFAPYATVIDDFIVATVTYMDLTKEFYTVPLRQVISPANNIISFDVTISKELSTIQITATKNSSVDSIKIKSIDYAHADNPFVADPVKTNAYNSIIADAFGVHVYNGNAFEGAARILTLGEYSNQIFGLKATKEDNTSQTLITDAGFALQKGDGSGTVWDDIVSITAQGDVVIDGGYLVINSADGKNRIYIDPVEGFKIQKKILPDTWENQLYIDPATGNVIFTGSISWDNVTDKPDITNADPRVDQIVAGTYMGGTFINGTTLYSPSISGGTLSIGSNGDGYNFVVDSSGNVTLRGDIKMYDSQGRATTMIDDYGINPEYLDYSKNLIRNSSFEIFNATTLLPTFWLGSSIGVVSSADSAFSGTFSCKIPAGQYVTQSSEAHINPAWYGSGVTRVSFYSKFGQIKAQVYDVTNSRFFTLTKVDGTTGTSITFDASSNWEGSRVSFSFNPLEAGGATCTEYRVRFENVHASENGYIDCIMAHPDFTGKYPQLYKDGQYSLSGSSVTVVTGDGTIGTVQDTSDDVQAVEDLLAEHMEDSPFTAGDGVHGLVIYRPNSGIHHTCLKYSENSTSYYHEMPVLISDEEPPFAVHGEVWIDSDNYSRHEVKLLSDTYVDTMSGEEVIVVKVKDKTVTLPAFTGNIGVVRMIKNKSDGKLTVTGHIDGVSGNKTLFPMESLYLVGDGETWCIM